MLTTGWIDHSFAIGDSETFIVSSTSTKIKGLTRCQPLPYQTQSMHALGDATGALLKVKQNHSAVSLYNNSVLPIVCGGWTSEVIENMNCYNVAGDSSNVQQRVGIMRQRREGAASIAVFNATTLWMTGGLSGGVFGTDTTEWIDLSEGYDNEKKLSYGTLLPMAVAYHCLALINDEIAILYGGIEEFTTGHFGFSSAWTVNITEKIKLPSLKNEGDQLWTNAPPMSARRAEHSCGVIREQRNVNDSSKFTRKIVVAAGGVDAYNPSLSSAPKTELLQIDDYHDGSIIISDSWVDGCQASECPLPSTLQGASSAVTDDQTMLFVTGGYLFYPTDDRSYAIYSFECITIDLCRWREEALELTFFRFRGVAMIIPPEKQISTRK